MAASNYIAAASPAPRVPRSMGIPETPSQARGENLEVDWFINLRWLAVLGVATAVFVGKLLSTPPLTSLLPLWAAVGTLLATNMVYVLLKNKVRVPRVFILQQAATDLSILTFLLHFSGGVENPFVFLYVFHAILGGILLPRKDAYAVSLGSIGLFLTMVLGEYFGWLVHHDSILLVSWGPYVTSEAARNFPIVAYITGAFVMVMVGTTYFTTEIMEGLRESQRHLLRTERLSTLGQLVAYVAHEVNNPIGIISTRAKIARSRMAELPPGEFWPETIEIIDRQADRVGQVVRSLLGLARLRPASMAPVDLNRAFSEAFAVLSGKISRASIEVTSSISPSLPRIMGRHSDLVHVFLNLLNNAVDAMPKGGRLTFETRRSDEWVVASVSDTGEGIPPENTERIFEPFFTTKPEGHGLGLGLPISLALIRSMGGQIEIEASPGKGSTFLVRLPLGTQGGQ